MATSDYYQRINPNPNHFAPKPPEGGGAPIFGGGRSLPTPTGPSQGPNHFAPKPPEGGNNNQQAGPFAPSPIFRGPFPIPEPFTPGERQGFLDKLRQAGPFAPSPIFRGPFPIPEPFAPGERQRFLDKLRQATPFAPSPHPGQPERPSILDIIAWMRGHPTGRPAPYGQPGGSILDFIRYFRGFPPGGAGIPAGHSSPVQADTYGYHKQRQQQRYQ